MFADSSKDSIYTDTNSDSASRDGHVIRRHSFRDYAIAYSSIAFGAVVFAVFLYFYCAPLVRAHQDAKAERRRQSLLRPLGLDNDSLRKFGYSQSRIKEKGFVLAPEEPVRAVVRDSVASKVDIRQPRPIHPKPFMPETWHSRSLSKCASYTADKSIDDSSSIYSFDHKSAQNLSSLQPTIARSPTLAERSPSFNPSESLATIDGSRSPTKARPFGQPPPVSPVAALASGPTIVPARSSSLANVPVPRAATLQGHASIGHPALADRMQTWWI